MQTTKNSLLLKLRENISWAEDANASDGKPQQTSERIIERGQAIIGRGVARNAQRSLELNIVFIDMVKFCA